MLVATRPGDWPLIFAVDASAWERCDAESSPERGFYYSASKHSAGQPIVAGWNYQWISQLCWRTELVDRPARRDPDPADRGHDNRDDRSGPSPRRPARRHHRRPADRARRRLRPDRHRPRTRRDTNPDPVPHPRRPLSSTPTRPARPRPSSRESRWSASSPRPQVPMRRPSTWPETAASRLGSATPVTAPSPCSAWNGLHRRLLCRGHWSSYDEAADRERRRESASTSNTCPPAGAPTAEGVRGRGFGPPPR